MKLWILGSGGLVGRALVKACESKGISYIASTKEEADVTRIDSLLAMGISIAPTHIVNCSAYTNVDKAEAEESIAYAVNALGPKHLGIVAKNVGAKCVHLSTDYVFSAEGENPFLEEDATNPINAYGRTKRKGEELLLQEMQNACVVRTSWVFGEGGKNYLSQLRFLFQRQEVLQVVDDQRGKITFAPDLAEALFHLLDKRGIFHFANDGVVSRYDVASAFLEEMQQNNYPCVCKKIVPISGLTFPVQAKRPAYSVLDTQKVSKQIPTSPRHWRQTIKEFFSYAKTT